MDLDRFILILKITNQFLCKYIYIFEHISHVKLAIYTFFKINLSHYVMFIHLNRKYNSYSLKDDCPFVSHPNDSYFRLMFETTVFLYVHQI